MKHRLALESDFDDIIDSLLEITDDTGSTPIDVYTIVALIQIAKAKWEQVGEGV